jgi:sigma-B regulation protein RsbU (phosphoserine phosphatase)
MLMATMRTLLSTHPEVHGDPGTTLSRLTRMFHALTPSDLFMTAVYLALRPGGEVGWSAAGQHPPLRVAANGEVAPPDLAPVGMPLGVEPSERYETVTWRVGPGERLVVFTDGIVEATNRDGRLFGLRGVRSALAKAAGAGSPEALLDALLEEVKGFMEGSDFEDDFTVLAVERQADAGLTG